MSTASLLLPGLGGLEKFQDLLLPLSVEARRASGLRQQGRSATAKAWGVLTTESKCREQHGTQHGLNRSSRGGIFPPSKGLEAAIKEPEALSVDRAEKVETGPHSTRSWGNQHSAQALLEKNHPNSLAEHKKQWGNATQYTDRPSSRP